MDLTLNAAVTFNELPDDVVSHGHVFSGVLYRLDHSIGKVSTPSGRLDGRSLVTLDVQDAATFSEVEFPDCLQCLLAEVLTIDTFSWYFASVDAGGFHFAVVGHLQVHILAGRRHSVIILDDSTIHLQL